VNTVVVPSLTPQQRRMFYFMDQEASKSPLRRFVMSHREIGEHTGHGRLSALSLINALYPKGLIKRIEHMYGNNQNGHARNEYLVMPSNPRKHEILIEIAYQGNWDKFDVMDVVCRCHQVFVTYGQERVRNMDLGHFSTLAESDRNIVRAAGMVLENRQLDLSKGIAHW